MQATRSAEILEERSLLAGNFGYVSVFSKTASTVGTGVVGFSIDADEEGNSYVTGHFAETVDFGFGPVTSKGANDIFVMKLNPSGLPEWVHTFGSSGADSGREIRIDGGEVFVAGAFSNVIDFDPGSGVANQTSAGFSDVFVLRLQDDGDFVDVERLGGTQEDFVSGMDVAAAGDVFITGNFQGVLTPGSLPAVTSAGSTDVFVGRLARTTMTPFSFQRIGGTGSDSGSGIAVMPGTTEEIAVTGSFSSTVDFDAGSAVQNQTSAGANDSFVLRQRGTTHLWVTTAGSTSGDGGSAVVMDANGNVYSGGFFNGTVDFDPTSGTSSLASAGLTDGYILKQNPMGTLVSVRRIGGTGGDNVVGVSLDEDGNVFSAGAFSGLAEFGNSNTTLPGTPGGTDIFVAKQNASGNFVFARGVGSSGVDNPLSIATTSNGDIFTTGRYSQAMDFDPGIGRAQRTVVAGSPTDNMYVLHLTPDLVVNVPSGIANPVVRRNGSMVQVVNPAATVGSVLAESILSETRSVQIVAHAGSINMRLDFAAGGAFTLPEGMQFLGNTAAAAESQRFSVIGTGVEGFTVRPTRDHEAFLFSPAAGVVEGHGQTILYRNLDLVDVTRAQAVVVAGEVSPQTLTVTAGFSSIGTGIRVAGTVGASTAMIPVNLSQIANLTIDTDAAINSSTFNDTVTVSTGGLKAIGLKNVTIRTGEGNDTINLVPDNLNLPVSGGAFWVQGGGGPDTLAVAGDVNWDLNDVRLVSGAGGRVQYDDVEKVSITGGPSANHINAATFTGSATIDGAAGNDLLRGGFGSDTIFGGTGVDRIFAGEGDDLAFGQDGNDILYGEGGDDLLDGAAGLDRIFGGEGDDFINGQSGADELYGGNGDDRLIGGTGNDSLFGESGSDILEGSDGNDLLDGGSGNDNLSGGVGVDLYVLQGTNNAEDLALQKSSASAASFRRKPRGLLSILEQDSITMDAIDEFFIQALGGDDLISVDATFTQLGSIDGGDGTDTSTAPAAWTKVSASVLSPEGDSQFRNAGFNAGPFASHSAN